MDLDYLDDLNQPQLDEWKNSLVKILEDLLPDEE